MLRLGVLHRNPHLHPATEALFSTILIGWRPTNLYEIAGLVVLKLQGKAVSGSNQIAAPKVDSPKALRRI